VQYECNGDLGSHSCCIYALKIETGFDYMKKTLLGLLLLMMGWVSSGVAEELESVDFSRPVMFNSDMDQHGTFIAGDLLTSPLLRSMFDLSVNEVNRDYVRICLNSQNTCRVVRRDSRVYLVVSNGKTKFDNSVTK